MNRGRRPLATLASFFVLSSPHAFAEAFLPLVSLSGTLAMACSLSLLGLSEMSPPTRSLLRLPWTCSLCPASQLDSPSLHTLK